MESYQIVRADSAPEWDALSAAVEEVWPEFILHDPVGNLYWEQLPEAFPAYQFIVQDADGSVLGSGNAVPLHLAADIVLPDGGWDWALEKAFTDRETGLEPNTLCGLQIGIAPSARGKGVSGLMIGAMKRMAQEAGFGTLVLPIRPTLKHRYPLIPMEDYIGWKNAEGLPFDPWLRAHVRSGAQVVRVCPRAMHISGSVREWEQWTGLSMQSDGDYVVESALVPVRVSVADDTAEYIEPNVWVQYKL